MPLKLKAILVTALVSASAAAGPGAGDALAGGINQRHVIVTHHRPSPCTPYARYGQRTQPASG